jgi:PAS domain-containing protein
VVDEDKPMVKRALRQMDGELVEYRWRRADGEILWIRSRMHREVQDGAAKANFGIVQDITRERTALHAAAEQLAAAKESEARFRSLTELSSDWYWEQDAAFRFVRVDGDFDIVRTLPSENYIGRTMGFGRKGVGAEQWAAPAALEAHEVFHDFEMYRPRGWWLCGFPSAALQSLTAKGASRVTAVPGARSVRANRRRRQAGIFDAR